MRTGAGAGVMRSRWFKRFRRGEERHLPVIHATPEGRVEEGRAVGGVPRRPANSWDCALQRGQGAGMREAVGAAKGVGGLGGGGWGV